MASEFIGQGHDVTSLFHFSVFSYLVIYFLHDVLQSAGLYPHHDSLGENFTPPHALQSLLPTVEVMNTYTVQRERASSVLFLICRNKNDENF